MLAQRWRALHLGNVQPLDGHESEVVSEERKCGSSPMLVECEANNLSGPEPLADKEGGEYPTTPGQEPTDLQ